MQPVLGGGGGVLVAWLEEVDEGRGVFHPESCWNVVRSFNPLCGWKGITSAGCRTLYVRRIWRFFLSDVRRGTVSHIPLPGSVTASPRSRWKCDVSPSGASFRLIPWSCDKNTKWLGRHPPLTWQRDHSRTGGGSRSSSSSSVQTVGEVWRGSGLHLLFPHSLCPWDARSVNTALPTFFSPNRSGVLDTGAALVPKWWVGYLRGAGGIIVGSRADTATEDTGVMSSLLWLFIDITEHIWLDTWVYNQFILRFEEPKRLIGMIFINWHCHSLNDKLTAETKMPNGLLIYWSKYSSGLLCLREYLGV